MLKSFLRDMLTYMPTKVLPAMTGLITTPILTRLFLPDEYGDWALAVGVADFLFAFAISGIGTAALRFFPAYKTKSELNVFFTNLLSMTGLAVGLVSTLSVLALFLLRSRLPGTLYPLLLISVTVFAFHSFFAILSEVLRVQNKSSLFTRLNLLNYYGSLGLGLVMVIAFGLRVEALMYGTLIIQILAIPLLIRSTMEGVRLGTKYFRTSTILSLWVFAWPLSFGNMAYWGLRISDRFIIEFFRSGIEVGLYSAVYNISDKTINLIVALFLLSMGPMVANAWEKLGREGTEQMLTKLTRLFLIICLPITVGLSLLALPFVTLLTGEAYHEGYRIVGYVAFSTFIWGLSRIACWGLILNNKTQRFAINQILAAILNIGLNLLLVPRYGYVVAGITTLIGYLLLLFMHAFTSRSYLTWRLPGKVLLNVSAAASLMGLVVFGINTLDTQGNGISLILLFLAILAGAIVYIGALWFLGEISDEEKNMVKRFCLALIRRPV